MTDDALTLTSVSKSLGKSKSKRIVVDNVSLDIAKGEIVALLGPNGAGKTTTAKIASTLLLPDSGEIRVCGIDAVRRPHRARAQLSLLLGGDRGFYLRMSAKDNLGFFATLAGVPANRVSQRVKTALRAVDLADRQDDRVETFSRGMRQRLHIARSLLAEPGLILLDEPTTGLDPESAIAIRRLISQLRATGAGILLTTHSMQEAENLADRVNIMDRGKLIESGSTARLSKKARIESVTVFNSANIDQNLLTSIQDLPHVAMVNVTEKMGSWDIDVGWESQPQTTDEGLFKGLTYLGTRSASLEEIYLAILHQSRGTV